HVQSAWRCARTATCGGRSPSLFSPQWLFPALPGPAVIAPRGRAPELPRPYRTWGYPAVPLAFVAGCCALTISLWLARPLRSTIGLVLILAGLPVHAWIVRGQRRPERAVGARA